VAQIMGKKLFCGPDTNLGWTPLVQSEKAYQKAYLDKTHQYIQTSTQK
jgi:hypothetical protein